MDALDRFIVNLHKKLKKKRVGFLKISFEVKEEPKITFTIGLSNYDRVEIFEYSCCPEIVKRDLLYLLDRYIFRLPGYIKKVRENDEEMVIEIKRTI